MADPRIWDPDDQFEVVAEPSVRDGWHRASCMHCDWYSTGAEPVVEEAGRAHVCELHGDLLDQLERSEAACASAVWVPDIEALIRERDEAQRATFAELQAEQGVSGRVDIAELRMPDLTEDERAAFVPSVEERLARLRAAVRHVLDLFAQGNVLGTIAAIPGLRDALEGGGHGQAR